MCAATAESERQWEVADTATHGPCLEKIPALVSGNSDRSPAFNKSLSSPVLNQVVMVSPSKCSHSEEKGSGHNRPWLAGEESGTALASRFGRGRFIAIVKSSLDGDRERYDAFLKAVVESAVLVVV